MAARRVHAGCGTRNPWMPWLWITLLAAQVSMWVPYLAAGTYWGMLGWVPWLLVMAAWARWSIVHLPSKMYRTWWP